MNREDYIRITKERLNGVSAKIMLEQIDRYYKAKEYKLPNNKYSIGEQVRLKKGTLIHGTYKNLDGLKEILKDGLISSWFIDSRMSKYPSSIGVWNLKHGFLLKDYINFYSGGTVKFFNQHDNKKETEVIPFDQMSSFMDKVISKDYLVWNLEQTKEARFLPSPVQDHVQLAIIFNSNNEYVHELLKGDILNPDNIKDSDVKDFVTPSYSDQFLIDRKNKDDFFTDRESAILFGIPANLIEGIFVGRKYEKDKKILKEIKSLLPNAYICNLDGVVVF